MLKSPTESGPHVIITTSAREIMNEQIRFCNKDL